MKYVRFLGTLDDELKPYSGVMLEINSMSYYFHGGKIATISLNSEFEKFPEFHVDMRGKFLAATTDAETCAAFLKKNIENGDIDKEKFCSIDGCELFVQENANKGTLIHD